MTRIEDSTNHEESAEDGYVLALCNGNVLRSQFAAEALKKCGIPAKSAAVGDISTQYFQGKVPPHIIGFGQLHELDLSDKRIKKVTPEMAANAKQIIAFCKEEQLPDFIRPDDPRVQLKEIEDVKKIYDPVDYERAVQDVFDVISFFVEEFYPSKKIKLTESFSFLSHTTSEYDSDSLRSHTANIRNPVFIYEFDDSPHTSEIRNPHRSFYDEW